MHRRPHPLLLRSILFRGAAIAPESGVVTTFPSGTARHAWPEIRDRVGHLAASLRRAGLAPGDRVGTLLWNEHRHLELAFAVPCLGAALHPANPRLPDADLEWTIRAAKDRFVFYDGEFDERIAALRERLPSVERWIRCGDPAAASTDPPADSWEGFVGSGPDHFEWPDLDEDTPMAVCFTSGTTGHPKEIVYTHRSSYLHTLGLALTDTMNLSGTDVALAVVPLFHAVSWGLPYAAGMLGATVVLPHRRSTAPDLLSTIESEKVSLAIGVPTVWSGVMQAARHEPARWNIRHLRRVVCGGGAPNLEMIEFFDRHYAAELIHSWGMTEINPVGTMGRHAVTAEEVALEPPQRRGVALKAGRPLPILEVEVLDERGQPVPHDDQSVGTLVVRGPTVRGGFAAEDAATLREGWMPTGDVATIDDRGRVTIRDREKDLIKSGGEWISSLALERLIGAMPEVALVAVIARPDPKWEERPIAVVELAEGASLDLATLRERLAATLPAWQLPDDLVFRKIPLTGTGKMDKKALRAAMG
ncbi:MAG: AMP-binding protein [Phycisphaerales bacterium]